MASHPSGECPERASESKGLPVSPIRLTYALAFGEPQGSLMAGQCQGECPERARASRRAPHRGLQTMASSSGGLLRLHPSVRGRRAVHGHTQDVDARVAKHNCGEGATFTRRRLPVCWCIDGAAPESSSGSGPRAPNQALDSCEEGSASRSESRAAEAAVAPMANRSAERREPVTRGTGNVFADLGFPDAAERQAKLRLAYALNQVLEGAKLSQAAAAKVLGVTQPKISALRHYKLAGFSVERLMNLLTALDQDVEMVIRAKAAFAVRRVASASSRSDRRPTALTQALRRLAP